MRYNIVIYNPEVGEPIINNKIDINVVRYFAMVLGRYMADVILDRVQGQDSILYASLLHFPALCAYNVRTGVITTNICGFDFKYDMKTDKIFNLKLNFKLRPQIKLIIPFRMPVYYRDINTP